jgi:hypothetical protein
MSVILQRQAVVAAGVPISQQIVAIQTAIAQGISTVSYGDKRVEYRSLNDMLQILGLLEAKLAGTVPTRQFRIVCPADKGL